MDLRGLIVFVLAIGLWLGWIARSARVQREAVAAIRAAGGQVTYGYRATISGRPCAASLVDSIGIDYLDEVVSVSFDGSATDQVMPYVGRT